MQYLDYDIIKAIRGCCTGWRSINMWRLKLLHTIGFIMKAIIILVCGTEVIISLLELHVLSHYTGH